MTLYRHRQIGTLLIVVLGLGTVLTGALLLQAGESTARLPLGLVLVLLIASAVLFASLTVEVRRDGIVVSFGPGLIRRIIPIGDIRDVRVVRNRWYYGWGIRRIPGGWLYNVSGLEAVELQLANGRRFRIGTDEPQRLAEAIRQAMQTSPPAA